MVRHAASLDRALGLPVTVVVSPENAQVAKALAGLEVTLTRNLDPHAEQGDSLRTGLASARLAAPGLLIALADQPLLTPADSTALLASFARHPAHICVPRHLGQRGNPVILPAIIARQLRDDASAPGPRAYMDANPGQIAWFEAPKAHFTSDIDTPQDAARLLTLSSQ